MLKSTNIVTNLTQPRNFYLSRRWYAAKPKLRKTCLHDFHVEHGGKMVGFAGFSMPLQYGSEGIIQSHKHTRTSASIFDVSHMLQTKIHGKDAAALVESITVADIRALREDQGSLSLFTTSEGGIIDDLIVTKTSNSYLYIVSNAGCRKKDKLLMNEAVKSFKEKGKDVDLEYLKEHALIALQGPLAAKVLANVTDVNLNNLPFMMSAIGQVCGASSCRITRCGYTGEDGFEISIPVEDAVTVTTKLLKSEIASVKLAGLGARDTLRIEAGLCLYGSDIDETTTPVEAGLAFTISKARRKMADFPGAPTILHQLKAKPDRKRIGIITEGGGSPRASMNIFNDKGGIIGFVTSGCPSPTLNVNIATGYVDREFSKAGTPVTIEIRKNMVRGQVTKLPFVPSKYYII